MRKRLLWTTFDRESMWMLLLCILVPLLVALLATVIPMGWRLR